MRKVAIVHSFHSQIEQTIENLLDEEYENGLDDVFCVDAHLDTAFPIEERVSKLTEPQKLAALRNTAHTLIRLTTGVLPLFQKGETNHTRITLAVPNICIESEIASKQLMGEKHGVNMLRTMGGGDPVEDWKSFIDRAFDINLHDSPPKFLLNLVKQFKGHSERTLFDIDIDYTWEMQQECYTPMRKTKQPEMGSMSHLLAIVDKVRPKAITVSEATVASITNPNSTFNSFLNRIKRFGYEVRYDPRNFKSDQEANTAIEFWADYFEKIVRPSIDAEELFRHSPDDSLQM